MKPGAVERRFTAALAPLIEQIKGDRSILAAILCGSLSHDTVWEKSDVDLLLVTVDDKKVPVGDKSLYADGVNIHALLMPRSEFRQVVEGATRNSFMHSFVTKGRLIFTDDPSLDDLWAALPEIGTRDTQLQLLQSATSALPPLYKARKWLLTREDLDYTALWILYAATSLARVEVVGRRLLADREVILQALALNPAFFTIIYTDLLNAKKTKKTVQEALEAAERYLAERAPMLFAPVLAYLREAGEARSAGEIEAHFKRNFNVECVTTACRVPRGPESHRQGVDAGPSDEEEQHRRPGARLLRPGFPAAWSLSPTENQRRRNRDGGTETEEQRRRRDRDGGNGGAEKTGHPSHTERRRYGRRTEKKAAGGPVRPRRASRGGRSGEGTRSKPRHRSYRGWPLMPSPDLLRSGRRPAEADRPVAAFHQRIVRESSSPCVSVPPSLRV